MALYPDTSCFYRAEVIESPKDVQINNRVSAYREWESFLVRLTDLILQGGPGSKHAVPMYRLKFEDDDDQEHLVQSNWVVEWPGGS